MEPKWNVKESLRCDAIHPNGINGTKVECKGWSVQIQLRGNSRINGTKVECKGQEKKFKRLSEYSY